MNPMNSLVTTFAASAALIGTSSAATTIAINLMRSATTTPAANDGSEYGISNWSDVPAPDQTITVDGVTVSWDTSGAWNGGGNNVENGYADNAGAFTATGLSAWLTANGATGYTVQTIGASDTADNWFGDTLLRDGGSGGALLDTLTNPNLRRGASTVSTELTVDVLYIDPTTGGTAPTGGGGARTSVAGIIIQAVPEPSSMLLIGLGGSLLLGRRRRE